MSKLYITVDAGEVFGLPKLATVNVKLPDLKKNAPYAPWSLPLQWSFSRKVR